MRPVSSEFLVLKAAPFFNVMDASVTSLIQHTTGAPAVSQLP